MDISVQRNPVFRPVWQSQRRYVVMKGSAGSGKSADTAQRLILRLLHDKGRNLLCVRKTEITHRLSTYNELRGAISRLGVGGYFMCTESPLRIRCINGNEIAFRGVKHEAEREKLKSITFEKGGLTDVWIEEATEITRSDFDIIDDRLRGVLPDGQFYQIVMTFNPVSALHWIKAVFFDRPSTGVLTHHSTYLDNRFCDEAYRQRMARRKELDPSGYVVYGLGEWGTISEGLILSGWEASEISQDTADYDDCAIGQDFGFRHANAILLLGWRDGDVYILREIYAHEKTSGELIAIADAKSWPKTLQMYCDAAEPDRIKMWRGAGYQARPVKKTKGAKDKSYVLGQIDWLKQRRIHIHPSCVHTIAEIRQWSWKKDEQMDAYVDEPVPFMDDAMAALRYGVEAWRKPPAIEVMKPVGEDDYEDDYY
ncbi:MAG: PBSX family phage terminase large subunit [Clostridiales Family XIII bacterium]|jgi:phage terminase large subunit|nr:PBSX family phage terminase large subunit [Clostridiales Family XIII bacterium]